MSHWRILLFKLLLLVLSLTVIEVSAVFILKFASASLLYPDLVPASGWTLGFFVEAFFALFVFGLGARRRFLHFRHEPKGPPLAQAVPVALAHECLIFKQSRTIVAIGFVLLRSAWEARADTFLATFARFGRQVERLAIGVASSIMGQSYTYVAIRIATSSQSEAIRRITTVGQALARSLSQQGITAEWIHDRLGVEQLYWMCVLGEEFHEGVTLDYRDGTFQVKVGTRPPRALTMASIHLESTSSHDGLLNLRPESPPHTLVLQLTPLDSNLVRNRLCEHSAAQPETLALIDTLGPDLAIEALAGRVNSDECTTIASLYCGCKEGLWQCTCHLICAPQDLETFAASLGCSPVPLEHHQFGKVATIAPSLNTPISLLPTSSLVRLLKGSEPRDPEPSAPASSNERRAWESVAEPTPSGGAPR